MWITFHLMLFGAWQPLDPFPWLKKKSSLETTRWSVNDDWILTALQVISSLNNSVPVEFAWNINVVHETLDVQWQVWGVGTHQLLELFTFLVESHQSSGLGLHIQLVLHCKLVTKMFDQLLIKVFSSHFSIKGCSKNLYGQKTQSVYDFTYYSWPHFEGINVIGTHLELAFIKGTHRDLVAWMANIHKHHRLWLFLRSWKILLVDPICQSNCVEKQ